MSLSDDSSAHNHVMKACILLSVLLLGSAVMLQAAGKDKDKSQPIPKEKEGRWGLYSFEEAKDEAAKKKRPLTILVVDESSKEASIKEAGESVFWEMNKDSTMVVIMSNLVSSGKGRLGDVIYGALTSEAIGKGAPRLIVTTPAADVILGQLTADQLITADGKMIKSFSRQMEASNKNPPPAGTALASSAAPATVVTATAPASVAIVNATEETWTNIDGVTITATLVEVDEDKVIFLMNGKKMDYSLAKLNDASRKRVDDLKAANLK